jgi:hypothetical protein
MDVSIGPEPRYRAADVDPLLGRPASPTPTLFQRIKVSWNAAK